MWEMQQDGVQGTKTTTTPIVTTTLSIPTLRYPFFALLPSYYYIDLYPNLPYPSLHSLFHTF